VAFRHIAPAHPLRSRRVRFAPRRSLAPLNKQSACGRRFYLPPRIWSVRGDEFLFAGGFGREGGFGTFNGDVPVAFSNASGKAMIVIFLAFSLSGIYPYLMDPFRVFWMRSYPPPDGGLDIIPCLLSLERFEALEKSLQEVGTIRISNLDYALGISSVLWQSDETLERPRDSLMRELRNLTTTLNFTNDEEMMVQFSSHLVEHYGNGCALEVMLSGVGLCPDSFAICHDLSMETLSAMQCGRWQVLNDSVKCAVLRALRKAAYQVPVENFNNTENGRGNTLLAYMVASLYALAFIGAGEHQRADALIQSSRVKVPLNEDQVGSLEQFLQCPSEDALQGLEFIAQMLKPK
jgi:hypothetical protein